MENLMARKAAGSSILSASASFLPSRLSFNPVRLCFYVVKSAPFIPARIRSRLFSIRVRASSVAAVETKPDPIIDEASLKIRKDILACPICYDRVSWNGGPDLSLEAVARSTLECSCCKKSYTGKDSHLDLTVTGGNKVYGEPMVASTELFSIDWILTVIDPHKDKVYVLDPLSHRNRDRNWAKVVDTAMNIFKGNNGVTTNIRKSPLWKIIQGPIQDDDKKCGFYVMRFMKEIVKAFENDN